MKGKRFDVKQFLGKNSVPVLFIIICAVLIPVSGLPVSYILNEAMTDRKSTRLNSSHSH